MEATAFPIRPPDRSKSHRWGADPKRERRKARLSETVFSIDRSRRQAHGQTAARRQLGGLITAQLPMFPGRPQATYLAWLDCRRIGDGEQPRNVFLDRGRVALEPGPRFGTPGSGFVRLNFGTSEAVLAQAIERMASALS